MKDKIYNLVNSQGNKNNPKYVCINHNYFTDKYRNRVVSIKNIETKEVKNVYLSVIKKGLNPFGSVNHGGKRLSLKEVTLLVNKLGSKATPQFKCLDPEAGFKERSGSKQRHRLVKIKCLSNKKIKTIELSNLKRGQNPFNNEKNRIEVTVVQPKYETLLKKHKLIYFKEFRLGKKSIDFVFIKKGKKYGLEVKQSDKWYSHNDQLNTYKKMANLKPYKIEMIILSDPKGNHKSKGSISLKDLDSIISNL